MDKIVYVKADKCILSENKTVTIGDIADIRCVDEGLADGIRNIILYTFDSHKAERYVMSVMDIIMAIQRRYSDIAVVNIGEADFIIEYNMNSEEKKWIEIIKVAVICLIVFFGAAFAIMSFHEDVGITGLFEDVYKFVMGKEKKGVSVIEVTYSIGLFLGILIFYNRFGSGCDTNDPSPLEMEMKTYEDTVNDTLIMTGDRE